MNRMKRKLYTLIIVAVPIIALLANPENKKMISAIPEYQAPKAQAEVTYSNNDEIDNAEVESEQKDNIKSDNIQEENEQKNNIKTDDTQAGDEQKDKTPADSEKADDSANVFLVNRQNMIARDFVPQSLRTPNVRFISYADSKVKMMDTVAAGELEKLFNDAEAAGITLLAVSGYRDYEYQQMLYAKEGNVENRYVSKPGASEHQTGLAMDLLSDEYTNLDEGFENTNAFKWVENNCYKYGFIIRYLKGKEDITGYNYEPWHIRYVGVTAATEMSQKYITLEEYLNKVR